jgi:hypothetical protein
MRLSRPRLILLTAVFGPLLVLALGITGGCQRQYVTKVGKRTLNCDTTIKVTPGALHGVDKDAVYVCDDQGFNQVTWVAPKGVTFTVKFLSTAPTDCPFSPCPASITDNTPQTVAPQPPVLTVYEYTITVTAGSSSNTYDPHVVGGGGY